MKQVNFFQTGSIVYALILNVVTKLKVDDVYIDVKQTPIVKYKLENLNSNQMTHLSSEQVFATLEELKEVILKQFDELTPKEVGECKKEETEATVS